MLGRVVLVVTQNSRIWRQVELPLVSAGNRVIRVTERARAVELVESRLADLLLVDWDMDGEADAVVAAAREVPVVALVGTGGGEALVELICNRQVSHVCTADSGEGPEDIEFDTVEIVATVEKLLRGDCFGLDKYIAGEGSQLDRQVVVGACDRDDIVPRLVDIVRSLGGSRRVANSVALVADELLTNAVYNAPRDGEGSPRYAHVSRREKIELEPTEYVRFEYGSDGTTFGLAVTDNFGALEDARVRSRVHTCLTADQQIEYKDGGAGLGLYTALSQASQLIINVERGVRTEVIALWSLDRKRKRTRGTGSLHLFCSEPVDAVVGGLDEAAVPEPSVELSESVKSDLRHLGLVASTAGSVYGDASEGATTKFRRLNARGTETHENPAGDLASLCGVTLLRRSDRPGLDTCIARIRGARTLGAAYESALTYLVNQWDAAVLMCRDGKSLVPWTAAGDVERWDDLLDITVPLLQAGAASPSAESGHSRWMRSRLLCAGVSAGQLDLDPGAERLGRLMGCDSAGQGLALSLAISGRVSALILACRSGSVDAVVHDEYVRLAEELTGAIERLEHRELHSLPVANVLDAEPLAVI